MKPNELVPSGSNPNELKTFNEIHEIKPKDQRPSTEQRSSDEEIAPSRNFDFV